MRRSVLDPVSACLSVCFAACLAASLALGAAGLAQAAPHDPLVAAPVFEAPRVATLWAPVDGGPLAPAQATDTPSASPTATPAVTASPTPEVPRFEPPPRALLTVGGETQEAGIGTYCWSGLCRCMFGGWIAPTAPMDVGSPFVGELRIDVEPEPTYMYLSVYRFESRADGRDSREGYAFWPPERARQVGPHYVLPPAKVQDLQLSRPPGLYVIGLNVYWEDVGDAAYGFLIEVDR